MSHFPASVFMVLREEGQKLLEIQYFSMLVGMQISQKGSDLQSLGIYIWKRLRLIMRQQQSSSIGRQAR